MNVINNKDLDDYLKDKSNEDMGLEIGEHKKKRVAFAKLIIPYNKNYQLSTYL